MGNRCKKCAAKTESHVLKVTPAVGLRTLAVAAALTFVFSQINSFVGGGVYSWIIAYVIGVFAGNITHRVSAYKMGPVIVVVVIAGIALGAIMNPGLLTPNGLDSAMLDRISQSQSLLEGENTPANKVHEEELRAAREQIAALQASMKQMQVWQLVKLGIFSLGLLTPFTGLTIPFPFPFRR